MGPGQTQVILWGSATCYLLHQEAQRRPRQGAGSSCSGLQCHSRSSGEELVGGDVGVRRGMELECPQADTRGLGLQDKDLLRRLAGLRRVSATSIT